MPYRFTISSEILYVPKRMPVNTYYRIPAGDKNLGNLELRGNLFLLKRQNKLLKSQRILLIFIKSWTIFLYLNLKITDFILSDTQRIIGIFGLHFAECSKKKRFFFFNIKIVTNSEYVVKFFWKSRGNLIPEIVWEPLRI